MNDVPQFDALMLPLLQAMSAGHEMTPKQMHNAVANRLLIPEEVLAMRLPSGIQSTFQLKKFMIFHAQLRL